MMAIGLDALEHGEYYWDDYNKTLGIWNHKTQEFTFKKRKWAFWVDDSREYSKDGGKDGNFSPDYHIVPPAPYLDDYDYDYDTEMP